MHGPWFSGQSILAETASGMSILFAAVPVIVYVNCEQARRNNVKRLWHSRVKSSSWVPGASSSGPNR